MSMKVFVRTNIDVEDFGIKGKNKKRGNPLTLKDNHEYLVKEFAHDVYGTYYKLLGKQLPFSTQCFFISDIGGDAIYVQVNVYVIVDLNPKKIPKGTLNPAKDLELRHHYKVKSAFPDFRGWMFELEGFEEPVLQKYMDVSRVN